MPPEPTALVGFSLLHVQHPGWWYHAAAVLKAHPDDMSAAIYPVALADQVIDLLTNSYEYFKRFRQVRMTIYLASLIAEQHQLIAQKANLPPEEQNRRYTMALKFHERIARTYRREGWYAPLLATLKQMASCAQELSMVEKQVEALLEQSSPCRFINVSHDVSCIETDCSCVHGRVGAQHTGS